MILETFVNQLLADMISASECLTNENIEDIPNKCFSYSEDRNFDSDDKEITESLLVLEAVLFGMSQFKSTVETPFAPC
jgi:hypothetical protein